MDDERIRTLLREELDRRELEAQQLCAHRRPGTVRSDLTVKCEDCKKVLDQEDIDDAYGGPPEPALSSLEQQHVGRAG